MIDNLDKRIESLSPAKRALLELRLKQRAERSSAAPLIPPRKDRDWVPLSFAQQRLWFLHQIETNPALYNVPRAQRLQGPLDLVAMQWALDKLVLRHETLRTRFDLYEGEVRQVIEPLGAIRLTFTDLTHLSVEERQANSMQLAKDEARNGFDLSRGPLMRAQVLKLGDLDHILLLNNHHIISDAWSGGLLFQELSELYNAFVAGEPSTLQNLPIQYADFAAWQRDWLQGDELQRQLDYWKNELAGATGVLELPTDHPRTPSSQSPGAYEFMSLSKELSSEIKELSKREGATVFMTLLAAFQVLLSRYSGQADLVVGSPIAGRNHSEIENLIGFFINTLALRADLSGKQSFKEFLGQVKETALGAYAHQDLPFERLVEELHPERNLNRNPLFQVMFQFQNTVSPVLEMKDLTVTALEVSTDTAKFDVMLAAREENDQLVCVMEYSTELFDPESIQRMLHQYEVLLADIVAQPNQLTSKLRLLTNKESDQIVYEWNQTETTLSESKTIAELFEAQVDLNSEATALIGDREHIAFGKLNERANQLAHFLKRRGVGPEVRVAICLERSVDLIVSLLGVLKAGGVYVPLEPSFPLERISFITENSQAKLILSAESHRPKLANVPVVFFDKIRGELLQESTANPAINLSVLNAAHVIYTSGSTGRPKGVISSHSASINRFAWMWQHYPFAAGEICCQKTALSFVDSIWEIFGPLLKGVPLAIIPEDVVKDPIAFLAALSANKVTRLVLVPSLLRAMLDGTYNFAELSNLRICVCSGEALSASLARDFLTKLPQTKLINLYGSSEVAADVTCFEVSDRERAHNVPIGRPIANTRVYVLDTELGPAAIGIPGEVFVAGTGLARGYLNQPGMTAERFIPSPFVQGERLFRTGDLGRYLPDGNIEYRGRSDHQVKLRGFRIELGEVEATLKDHPGISEAVVVLRQLQNERAEEKQLVAYFVPDGERPSSSELRAYLRAKLPDFMVPSIFVKLEEMPLTASGKLNRLALPEPEREEELDEFVAPRTPTEDVLANIWSKELNLDVVGVNNDFFALGGHSLLLARIAARVSESCGVQLPLRELFEASTVAALAERVERARRLKSGSVEPRLAKVSRERPLPMSFAQERLWFFDQLEPGSAAYNISRAVRLKGALHINALQDSINALFKRHEVLRSTFQTLEGKPVSSFDDAMTADVTLLDLTGSGEEQARTFVARENEKPFDLARGPLLRVALAKLAANDHLLVLTMHHIVSDGWSVGIAVRELIAGYNSVLTQSTLALPPLSLQYADFALWQREYLGGSALEPQLEFWRNQLKDAPVLINLPTDRPRASVRSFRGARQSIHLNKEINAALKLIARHERATLFMTLLTTFQLTLAGITGDEDIVVGSPIAGRTHPEIENLIGYFVNTLVLRTQIKEDSSFQDILGQVRDTSLASFGNQDVPFEKLVDELAVPRSLEFNPLFQVWFVLQNAPSERQAWHSLQVEAIDIESTSTRHDLQLTMWENDGTLEGAFTYSTDLFDSETITGFAEQFRALLSLVTEDPTIAVSEMRSKLKDVAVALESERAGRLASTSHERLRSTRRRAVTLGSSSAETLKTIENA